jgi:uncharacterized delta-60 repeat protein
VGFRGFLVGIVSLACLAGLPGAALADGTLDYSFGGTGTLTLDAVPDYVEGGQAVAVDSQGRILVADSGRYPSTAHRAGFVLRYLPNGTLDTTFSAGDDSFPDGIKDIAKTNDVDLNSITIDSQGRIVVGGWYSNSSNQSDLLIARLAPDGKYDTSFGGGDGSVVQDLGGQDYPSGITTDAQDRILVAGTRQAPAESIRGFVARFNTDGQLDPTFGGTGWIDPLDNPSEPTGISSVAVDSNQRLVLGGSWFDFERMAVIRLLGDGSRDSSFGQGGLTTLSFDPTASEGGDSLAIDPQGRINLTGVIHGNGSSSGRANDPNDLAVARLLPDGAPDPAFSDDGMNRQPIEGGDLSGGRATLDRAGRLVTVNVLRTGPTMRSGSSPRGASISTISSLIARFRADGSFDTSFGQNGQIEVSKPERTIQLNAVTTDGEGRYVFAGKESDDQNNSQLILSRYLVDYPNNNTSQLKLKLGKAKLNRKKGTAVLPVTVNAAAKITLTGKNVKKKTLSVKKAKTVKLTVIATGKLKRSLRRQGKAVAKLKISAKPSAGGKAVAKKAKVKLKLKKKHHSTGGGS